MKFYISGCAEPDCTCIEDRFLLKDDGSLLYTCNAGDYSVLLGGNWRFELIVDSTDGHCTKIQCFLDELAVFRAEVKIPDYSKGYVYLDNFEELEPYGGCQYLQFDDAVLWDESQMVMCIGNPYIDGTAVEFAHNIVAVIQNDQLRCLYLMLDGITGISDFLSK